MCIRPDGSNPSYATGLGFFSNRFRNSSSCIHSAPMLRQSSYFSSSVSLHSTYHSTQVQKVYKRSAQRLDYALAAACACYQLLQSVSHSIDSFCGGLRKLGSIACHRVRSRRESAFKAALTQNAVSFLPGEGSKRKKSQHAKHNGQSRPRSACYA